MGDVSNIAGTNPIRALINAVKTNDTIISLIFIGAMNKFVKFLLHISSKNNILNPILVLNKKSYKNCTREYYSYSTIIISTVICKKV